MTRIQFTIPFLLFFALFSAQSVILSKAEKVGENKDNYLYRVDSLDREAIYLGEIEVRDYSRDDAQRFREIYQKAKTLKANAFRLKHQQRLDESSDIIDPSNYTLELYDIRSKPNLDNWVFLFSSSEKEQKVRINEKQLIMPPRSYVAFQLTGSFSYSIRAGGLLGSKIQLSQKLGQPVQYFQVLPSGVRADQSGYEGGLRIKSGDLIGLERSYADYLRTIYEKYPIKVE